MSMQEVFVMTDAVGAGSAAGLGSHLGSKILVLLLEALAQRVALKPPDLRTRRHFTAHGKWSTKAGNGKCEK